MKKADKILKEALIKNNVLSSAEAATYLSQAHETDQSLKDFLLSQEIVDEKQILIALSQTLGIDMVDINQMTIDPAIVAKVPVKFAWYYKFIPIQEDKNTLIIAVDSPMDIKTLDEIRLNIGQSVKAVLTTSTDLVEALKKYYGLASDTLDKIMMKEPPKHKVSSSDSGQWVEDLEQQNADPTVSNLVNQIILESYKMRATDIHIEPYRDKVRFRYRIDGVLVDANLPDQVKHFLPQILSRIKILANLSITEKRLPQDGSAVVKTKEQQLDLRVSTMPTPRGESMVIRVLPSKVMLFSLEKLGFTKDSLEKYREIIRRPHGIIFMTGPTGSGKTTTLYAGLNEINSPQRKVITIEDPVEYEMQGITQVQVNTKVNFTFSVGLRSLLRHDPDVIMVGEVRDVETAEIAIRTALTGHLVFSTLHTNDAASGMTRLIDMGVEPYLAASSVEAFVAQRLVRIICPKCKVEDKEDNEGIKKEIARSLNIKDIKSIKIYHGKGCEHCNRTGYYGRKAIYEILEINDVIRTAILEKPRANYIKNIAIQQGMTTLRQSGWKAVMDGVTTPEEVVNVTVKDDDVILGAASKKVVAPIEIPDHEVPKEMQELTATRLKKKSIWAEKNQYEARIYPRVPEHVEIRYRPLKWDPKDNNFLLPDGIEHTTVTEDLSAGGLRFVSKELLPIGTILEVKIRLDESEKSVNCLAKVCRAEQDTLDNIYTMVNYYLDLSSADRVAISKFVEHKLKEI